MNIFKRIAEALRSRSPESAIVPAYDGEIITINHGLNDPWPMVSCFDENKNGGFFDYYAVIDANTIEFRRPTPYAFTVVVIGGGGRVVPNRYVQKFEEEQ